MLFNNDIINSIRDEWKVFIFITDAHAMLSELPGDLQINEYWQEIFDIRNIAKKLKYENLSTFIKTGRPSYAVIREASCCTKGLGFESRVRHGCQTVHFRPHQWLRSKLVNRKYQVHSLVMLVD